VKRGGRGRRPAPGKVGAADARGSPLNKVRWVRVVLSRQFAAVSSAAWRIGGLVVVAIVTLFYSGLLLAKSFLFRLTLVLRSAVRPLTPPGASPRHRP
jgi:hypothetical protein